MDHSRKNPQSPGSHDAAADSPRRRIGRIVHDERGNATVDWHVAPSGYKRTKLEIADDLGGSLSVQKAPQTFNPYERSTVRDPKASTAAPRKDLRKLSEWIKQMRELEERKRKEETGEE